MKPSLTFLLIIVTVAAAITFSPVSPRRSRAQTGQGSNPACCGGHVAPREVDFPYYNLTNGWTSTLNLVSDSPKSTDFTLAIKGKPGQVLTAPETIGSRAKLAIDIGTLITQLGGDISGAFAEGSVAVYFTGTIMPLNGQITIATQD